MVVNVVLVNQIKGIIDSMKKSGFETEAINVQINRGKDMAAGIRLEALNPIWIITGTKV
jgi:precorrin-6Y C5,15-methyltransferase (decarboxylating)